MAMQTISVVFSGAGASQTVTWDPMPGNFGIADGESIGDAGGPAIYSISNRTSTGCTVTVADPGFVGTIELLLYDKP